MIAKDGHGFQTCRVFCKNTQNEKDTILGVGNDCIGKDGMGMPTALANHSGNDDFMIDRFSMDDINDGSGIGCMNLTVPSGMTRRAFFQFRLKRSHEIKK